MLVNSRQITIDDLPKGIWVGIDSMGPARDPRTDALFPGIKDVLHKFTQTMLDYNLGMAIATNGPPKEAYDILSSLNMGLRPRAFGAAEGGGVIVELANGALEERIIALQIEVGELKRIGDVVKQSNPLIEVLMEDVEANDGEAPMRTPYKTNIVITLPNQYETLQRRLEAKGVNVSEYLPEINGQNYIGILLEYIGRAFSTKIQELGLTRYIGAPIVKISNKRVYIPTRHVHHPNGPIADLSKYNGVVAGSALKEDTQFELRGSIYIADYAVDKTRGEGAEVLGASERSMIKNGVDMVRLALNITMDDKPPMVEHVEGVKILNIGSGLRALEAIDLMYRLLHRYDSSRLKAA